METKRKLPDQGICLSKQIGSGRDAYRCLVVNPFECAFAKKFGSTDTYLCFRNSDDYGNPE